MDPTELQRTIGLRLSDATGHPVEVRSLTPLLGGACQDNLRVEVAADAGELAGEHVLVLRSDAPGSLPDSIDRAAELAVIQAAVAAGVMTPAARWLSPGLVREGAQAYFLDWRDGVAIGRKVVGSDALAPAREVLPGQLAQELARIHTITPASAPALRDALGAPPTSAEERALEMARTSLDRAGQPRASLEEVLAWLRERVPEPGPVVLAHGDYRTGNFLVTPAGLSAVLDWEFAHWGTPAEDLAWLCVRDWRFGRLDRPVGGVSTREPFYAAYAAAGGALPSKGALHWWEVMGNLRWATGCLHQGRRYLEGEQDLELIAIARRGVEMEWEALRLIDPNLARAVCAHRPAVEAPDVPGVQGEHLLGALSRFLVKDVAGAVSDRGLAFRLKIAAHLLQTLSSEHTVADPHDRAARERLRGLLPRQVEPAGDDGASLRGELAALEAALASALRSGILSPSERAVRVRLHLLTSLRDRLSIVSPRFDPSPEIEPPWTSP